MSVTVVDGLGRHVRLGRPRRIVSLVPSDTESVAALVGPQVLVGRTEYCVEPAAVLDVATVGGTKSIDVDAVLRLSPDLVLANKEENGRVPVERLIDAGLSVLVSFPRSVSEALAWLVTLARALGVPDHPIVSGSKSMEDRCTQDKPVPSVVRTFVPIWRDPWMTFNADTYGSDVLRCAGAENIFGDRDRRYPLAADLGRSPAAPTVDEKARDTRYPRVVLDEVRQRRPEIVLLPDEPYVFRSSDADEIHRELGIPARLVDGKDLFWYGVRTLTAIDRVRRILQEPIG